MNAPRSRVDERLDVIATVLLAIATVATAWSGYQASRWNGEAQKAAGRSNALRIESAKAAGLGNAQTEIDVATFSSWVDAYAQGETKLAAFYFKRFRTEFKPAVNAWVATHPLKNRQAPLTPFAMPQYRLVARAAAVKLQADADASAQAAVTNIGRATDYVLAVVLLAAALFFAGMSVKLQRPALRRSLLIFGLVAFLGTVAWVATFPVSVAV
jgi:hypothetical protein